MTTKKGKIFLVGEKGKLTPMIETEYASEEILQVLLANYPDLLPGDQISPENPCKWLLVRREIGVPAGADEGDRWSLDHLFLDQEGIPTFVECKRATDTRARREVVAQMLDYAANGTEYWSMDRLRQAAAETAKNNKTTLDEEVFQLTNTKEEADVETYWGKVEENLQEGRVRLVFVADEIPKELRRLVEFLNDKMKEVLVIAVEIKQFLGEGQKAVVPRVIGLTEAARKGKGGSSRKPVTKDELLSNCTPIAATTFKKVLDVAEDKNHNIYWGTVGCSVRVHLPEEDRYATFVYCMPPASFEFYFSDIPLPEEEKATLRKELLEFGVFKEAGKQTLKATIDEKTKTKIDDVYSFILKRVDDIRQIY